jgi:hypothetical protein
MEPETNLDEASAPVVRENYRLKACAVCHRHVGQSNLFEVRHQEICALCGLKEVERWNKLVRDNV